MKRYTRKATKLTDQDYSQPGRYAITLCAYLKEPLFGRIDGNDIKITDIGEFVSLCWKQLNQNYPATQPESYVVMPNHFHGILLIKDQENDGKRISLPGIIRNFKAYTAREYYLSTNHRLLWQRGYYEHIIRDDADLHRIESYIHSNVATWKRDKFYLVSFTQSPHSRGGAPSPPVKSL